MSMSVTSGAAVRYTAPPPAAPWLSWSCCCRQAVVWKKGEEGRRGKSAPHLPRLLTQRSLLLQAGANASHCNTLGLTPLHACCCRPNGAASAEVARLLLGAGADCRAVTLPDADPEELAALEGDTPLTLAAQHAFPTADAAPLVEALLHAGADPLQPSLNSHTTALEYACAAGGAPACCVRTPLHPPPTFCSSPHTLQSRHKISGVNCTYVPCRGPSGAADAGVSTQVAAIPAPAWRCA